MANTISLQKAKHTNYGYEYTHQVQWNLQIMHILNAYWMIEESEHSQSNYYRSGFHWNRSKHLRHSVHNTHTLKDNDSHVVETVPVPFESVKEDLQITNALWIHFASSTRWSYNRNASYHREHRYQEWWNGDWVSLLINSSFRLLSNMVTKPSAAVKYTRFTDWSWGRSRYWNNASNWTCQCEPLEIIEASLINLNGL